MMGLKDAKKAVESINETKSMLHDVLVRFDAMLAEQKKTNELLEKLVIKQ